MIILSLVDKKPTCEGHMISLLIGSRKHEAQFIFIFNSSHTRVVSCAALWGNSVMWSDYIYAGGMSSIPGAGKDKVLVGS